MASDKEVRTQQTYVIEVLHAEKKASVDIHRRLLNVHGDQTVAAVGGEFQQWRQTGHVLGCPAQQRSAHEMNSASISPSAQIGGLRTGNCVWSYM
jgi:hypothetical protein